MLVLTRKPNQKLNIGGDIVITVVKVRGNTIRLGIEAPKDVRVIRSELEIKTDVEPNGTASNAGDTSSESNLTNNSTDDLNGSSSANTSDNSNNAVLASHLTGTTTGSSNMSVTQFTAMAKHDKRSASMGYQASIGAPLRAFKNRKHPQDPAAAQNLEDSPLCHRDPSGNHSDFGQRTSLGQRDLQSPGSDEIKSQHAKAMRALRA